MHRVENTLSTIKGYNKKNYPFLFYPIRLQSNQRNNPWNLILILPKDEHFIIEPADYYTSGINHLPSDLIVLYAGSTPVMPIMQLNNPSIVIPY